MAHGTHPTNRIPLVDLKAQYLDLKTEMDAALQTVLDTTSFILGPHVEAFEEAFARFCGAEHCIGMGNGTDATVLALEGLGVRAGDEVITVAHTFIATAEGISELGAVPVFVDVREDSLLMDVAKVEAAITPRTRALLPVHLYGQTVDMDPLLAIARRHGLKVLEDAPGARRRIPGPARRFHGGRRHLQLLPWQEPGRLRGCRRVVTRDGDLAAWLQRKRNHGRATKSTHDFPGRDSRMDGLQGAVLNVKLPRLDGWNASRRALAAHYDALLAPHGIRRVGVQEVPPRLPPLRRPGAQPGRRPGQAQPGRGSRPGSTTRSPYTCRRPMPTWASPPAPARHRPPPWTS